MAAVDGDVMRSRMRLDLLQHYLHHGFVDDDDLAFYLQEFTGFAYPRVAYCSHHTPPFDIIADVFFNRVTLALIFASRSGGKTQLFALLNHLDMLFQKDHRGRAGVPVDIINAGAVLDQAQKGYRYFRDTFTDPLLADHLVESLQSRSVTKNGSLLEIVAGTFKALNGPHSARVRLDEVELMPWDVLQEAFSISISKHGVPASDCLASTRKFASGTMSRLLDDAADMGMHIASWCVFDVVEQCTRECHDDPRYGDCPIFNKCQGRAHGGSGWFRIDDLIKKARTMTRSTFEAQWENKNPTDAPTVYGEYFDPALHVLTWQKGQRYKTFSEVFHEAEIPRTWRRLGGIDFGSNFVFLAVAIEPKHDIWVVYHEYFCNADRLLAVHAKHIKDTPGFQRLNGRIYADPAAKQDRMELQAYGIRTRGALRDVMLGVDEVKSRLEVQSSSGLPRLFIMEQCKRLLWEMGTWSYLLDDAGLPMLDVFEQRNDHAVDAARYIIFSHPRVGGKYRTAYVQGV